MATNFLDKDGLIHFWAKIKEKFVQKELKTGSQDTYKVLSDNNLTAPMYLRKAALAANAMGNKEQALGFAQRIQNEFPASAEAQNAEKLMGTIQQ